MKNRPIYLLLFCLFLGCKKEQKNSANHKEIAQLASSKKTLSENESFNLDIILGSAENQIDNITDFVLQIELDSTYIETFNVDTDLLIDSSSFLSNDSGSFSFNSNGSSFVDLYYNNSANRSGQGKIATIKLITEDDVPVVGVYVPFKIKNIIARNKKGDIIEFEAKNEIILIQGSAKKSLKNSENIKINTKNKITKRQTFNSE